MQSFDSTEYDYVVKNSNLIADYCHRNHTRWDKVTPYIVHPRAVAKYIQDNYKAEDVWFAMSVAILHDVFEDATEDDIKYSLKKWPIPDYVASYAKNLNKNAFKSYEGYIEFVGTDPILSLVKFADIMDNYPTAKDSKKGKYREAAQYFAAKFKFIDALYKKDFKE